MIIKVSEVITIDKSDVHIKWQSQRSEVKVTELKKMPLFVCFLALAPVRIHRWLRNDAKSQNGLRRCALLFSKFTHQIFKVKIDDFYPNWAFLDCTVESTDDYGMIRKAWKAPEDMPHCFPGHPSNLKENRDRKIDDLVPIWAFPDSKCNLNSWIHMKCHT